MKSGLEDRNNFVKSILEGETQGVVSMKSGLEDRNNLSCTPSMGHSVQVSMKSGLEDRNNWLASEGRLD